MIVKGSDMRDLKKKYYPSSNMKATIIIPNFNGKDLLKENLPAVVAAKEFEENKILEIIVVDNGSTDGSINFIKKNFPEIKIIKHKINRGFSAGVNIGARFAKGDLVVLLNSDVKPEKNFLVNTLPHFIDKRTFAVSFHEKGYGASIGIFKDGFIVHEPCFESNSKQYTFWVSGGSGAFRRSDWMKLGGMDEKLFSPAYWEDIDLSYRALKRGFRLIWEPNSNVIHKHESTVLKFPKGHFEKIKERNQLLFTWKNLTSQSLFKKHIAGLFKRVFMGPGYLKIIFMAFMKLKDVIRLRNKEIKETWVSDEAIFSSFNNK